MGGVGKRRTGSAKSRKTHKQQRRKGFEGRHLDQIWEDLHTTRRSAPEKGTGPVGTTTSAVLDEDLPGGGEFYCGPCSRYFTSAAILRQHALTKPHKRRVKSVAGARPHGQLDADAAGGMGAPDNGPRAAPLASPAPSSMQS